jgi:hypothetical protein
MLRAGASVTIITPPLGHPLAGLFHRREATTVVDDLTSRAIVLDDGRTRLAIVVCDLIALKAQMVNSIRALIQGATGIPPANVMISCTHTHTGPVTSPHRSDAPDPAYMDWLVTRVADGVKIAFSRLQPAQVAHGSAPVSGVCFNRRYRMRDGTVVFNPGTHNPDVIGPAGPTDPAVTALLVESTKGVPIALWSCLSTHYAGTDDDYAISPDYYGEHARVVRAALGDRCVGAHANGASGNINTIDVTEALGRAGAEKANLVGLSTAAAAIQGVATRPRSDSLTLATSSVSVGVNRWPVSNRDVEVATDLMTNSALVDDLVAGSFSYLVGQSIPAYQIHAYAQGLLDLAAMPETAEAEVQVLRIGEFAIAALPGEVFVEFGLELKESSPFSTTAVVGLANGNLGYLPTRTAFGEGGYETWRGDWTWTAEGTGELLVESASRQLQELAALNRSASE